MRTSHHFVHGFLLIGFGVCVLTGAILLASIIAILITYWFRAYGVALMVILVDALLGAFYAVPWLSLIGILWLMVSELTRPLLIISNQDTV